MQKLLKELAQSIEWKSKDIERYTKMINLLVESNVKGIRKFIYEQETCEKEMFYEMLQWGAPELFSKVYPKAEEQEGRYAVEIICNQFTDDIKELGWDNVILEDEGSYPENYSDEKEECCGGCGCNH